VILTCCSGAWGCGIDDRVLSPCGEDDASAPASGSGGKRDGGAGGSTSHVDGSPGGSGGTSAPDGSGPDGAVPPGSGGGSTCTDCSPNLVVNSAFDSDVEGWTAENKAAIEWDATDSAGRDSSGSIQVHNNNVEDIDNKSALGARQCAPAVAGKTYELSAKVQIRVTEGSGNGHLNVAFYAGTKCEPPILPKGGMTTLSAFQLDGWENDRGSILAPEGTGSVVIRLVAEKPIRQDTLEVVFDDVSVVAQ
jgi:hypothetical protein